MTSYFEDHVPAYFDKNSKSSNKDLEQFNEYADTYHKDYMKRQEATKDNVNSPDHYTHNGIEAIDVIRSKLTTDQFEGYLQGSVMKYLLRSNYKGKREEDLKKAQWYLNVLVEATSK